MLKRIGVFCVCLVLPQSALADTIVAFADGFVTWEASGVTSRGFTDRPSTAFPPIGTPFTMTLTFNPSATRPTSGLPSNSHCVNVNLSGTLELGGVSFVSSGSSSLGFTHAALPGTNCVPNDGGFTGFTQFSLPLQPVDGSPWDVSAAVLIASYRDLLVQDAFPEVPSGTGTWWIQSPIFNPRWEVGGLFAPVAIDQPAAVPEPGTLVLFSLGLAAAARRLRPKRS